MHALCVWQYVLLGAWRQLVQGLPRLESSHRCHFSVVCWMGGRAVIYLLALGLGTLACLEGSSGTLGCRGMLIENCWCIPWQEKVVFGPCFNPKGISKWKTYNNKMGILLFGVQIFPFLENALRKVPHADVRLVLMWCLKMTFLRQWQISLRCMWP